MNEWYVLFPFFAPQQGTKKKQKKNKQNAHCSQKMAEQPRIQTTTLNSNTKLQDHDKCRMRKYFLLSFSSSSKSEVHRFE